MTETIADAILEASTPAKLFKIQLNTHDVNFTGWQLAHSSTESNYPRWTTMHLYRVANPQTDVHYVVLITGRSVVYHITGRDCSSGERLTIADLPDEAEPCPKCVHRSQRLAPTTPVQYEEDIMTLHECRTPVDVVRALLVNTRGAGNRMTASKPAQDLLAEAAIMDPAFNPRHIEVKL